MQTALKKAAVKEAIYLLFLNYPITKPTLKSTYYTDMATGERIVY